MLLFDAPPLRPFMPSLTCAAWFDALLGAGAAEALEGGAVDDFSSQHCAEKWMYMSFLASSSPLCAPKQEACAPMCAEEREEQE
jgi:hypothetical protein